MIRNKETNTVLYVNAQGRTVIVYDAGDVLTPHLEYPTLSVYLLSQGNWEELL